MNQEIHKMQIFKFGLYGLLKNLRFFEPFFILFLLDGGLNLFQIGLLYSIREIIIYIFEIPSGVIADQYGKKLELIICFMFYILSFIIFYVSDTFYLFAIAMILFGLGEAFRSGTHKAMIMAYIDHHELKESKTKIYGLTRSYSLIGSMISSLLAVVFVLWLPEIRWLFVVSVVPYVMDMLLIISYPSYLNQRQENSFSWKSFFKQNFSSISYAIRNTNVRNAVLNASTYQAGFKIIKDYIQPIIISLSVTIIIFSSLTIEEHGHIYIGLVYAVIYLISSFASKNAYVFKKKFDAHKLISLMWLLSGLSLLMLSLFLNQLILIMLIFVLLFAMMNIRRPIMVEVIGDVTESNKRASVLSIESQLTSLWIAIFAPIMGLIADYSIQLMLIILGSIMCLLFIGQTLYRKNGEIV